MATKSAHHDDRSLLERVKRGDKRAIASLYDRHASILYSMALHVLGDVPKAEQVVSDIFVEIWRRPHFLLQTHRTLLFVLVLVARNRAVAILRNQPDAEIDFGSACALESTLPQKMARAEALRWIEQLPAAQRVELERAFFLGATSSPLEDPAAKASKLYENQQAESAVSRLSGTGLEVIDIECDRAFAKGNFMSTMLSRTSRA